jgi:ribonuclease R
LRFKNGSINFESDEIRFDLDENNKPIGVFIKERKESNMLIEDFMLLANKAVASYIHKKSKNSIPFVYRIHDLPDETKLTDFALFAKELGYQMHIDTPKQIAASFNGLAEAALENETLRMLEPLAIRTMAKAEYSTENIGHYGLAFDYYTHFTSPIRRYSDVLVHRLLQANLSAEYRMDKEILEQKCKHISRQERKANDAERDSIKYKQVEYMMDKTKQEFIGTVSGMIDRGFFVEIGESKAEGLVPFNHLDEPFVLSASKLKAVGRRSGNELKMGTKVKVKLEDADLDTRKLEFTLIDILS